MTMPKNQNRKDKIRAYAAQYGLSYTTAMTFLDRHKWINSGGSDHHFTLWAINAGPHFLGLKAGRSEFRADPTFPWTGTFRDDRTFPLISSYTVLADYMTAAGSSAQMRDYVAAAWNAWTMKMLSVDFCGNDNVKWRQRTTATAFSDLITVHVLPELPQSSAVTVTHGHAIRLHPGAGLTFAAGAPVNGAPPAMLVSQQVGDPDGPLGGTIDTLLIRDEWARRHETYGGFGDGKLTPTRPPYMTTTGETPDTEFMSLRRPPRFYTRHTRETSDPDINPLENCTVYGW